MRAREADRLLRLIVSQRVRCEQCGGVGTDTAHIIRRRYNATRCDETNCWWLCRDCHRLVDLSPAHHTGLVARTIGWAAHDELRDKAHAGPPEPLSGFWPAERARLRERCKSLGIPTRRAS